MMRSQGSENAESSCSCLYMRDVFKFGMNVFYYKANLERKSELLSVFRF